MKAAAGRDGVSVEPRLRRCCIHSASAFAIAF